MKRVCILLITGIIGLLTGLAIVAFSKPLTPDRVIGHANWASQAKTIPEVISEADIVVRVRVDHTAKVRKLKQWLPTDTPDKKPHAALMPFTDTKMQVVEVYKGTVDKHITIMQTGGQLPAADGDPAMHIETHDDPIFVRESEHVLFLVDISDDAIHGQGRKLYRTVSPAGRYAIQDGQVFSPAELSDEFTPPSTLSELVEQIQQTLGK